MPLKFSPRLIPLALLITLNLVIFILAVSQPILWQQGEITYHNFFWSSNLEASDPNMLRSGLHKSDFLKLFMIDHIEYSQFRSRFISYLIEMLPFKFWQFLEITDFHNYTLIMLHVLNTFLLGFFIYHLTKSKRTAIFGMIFFLNSSIALCTLLFPFRNAKILIVTFFLLALLIPAQSKKKIYELDYRLLFLFYFIILLMCLTDELAVFAMVSIFAYIIAKDGIKTLVHKYVLTLTILICSLFIFLIKINLLIINMISQKGDLILQKNFFKNLFSYILNPLTLQNTGEAFINYFLRRNYGFWDFSFWGSLSFICFLLLIFLIFFFFKVSDQIKRFLLALIFIFILKQLLSPHTSGLHPYIMPPDAFFPSLMYFSYYYPYFDSLLICLLVALLLNHFLTLNIKNISLIIYLITIINISNFVHIPEGLVDTLRLHHYYFSHQNIIPKLITLNQIHKENKNKSIYLSFPSGSSSIFSRYGKTSLREIDPLAFKIGILPEFYNYGSLVPVHYLKFFEKGNFVMSLQNAPSSKRFIENELDKPDLFYDVHQQKLVDLQTLRRPVNLSFNRPELIEGEIIKENFIFNSDHLNSKIVFFVKGAADISVKKDRETQPFLRMKQNYGYSFQLFMIPSSEYRQLNFEVKSLIPKMPCYFIGPFIYDTTI